VRHPILGLHHVTATVDQAQADLDFYRDLLGLRLVKQTVNFDNHNVYHFYYGDEPGTPGTLWTTFPYGGWGVPRGRHGRGQIIVTSFSVPVGSLGFWSSRLAERGLTADVTTSETGSSALRFTDSSGLALQLVEDRSDPRSPWTGNGVGAESAIRGLHSVRLSVRDPGPTTALLTEILGFVVTGEHDGRVRLAVNGDLPGRRVELVYGPEGPAGLNGLGTVHHVAFAIESPEEQLRLRRELVDAGYRVTEVLDRQYFRSIYFREPGGVLLEAATVGPGFTADEELSELGRRLKLPPWEEPNREVIEQRLSAIV
jgi:glyoxalase family protein